MSRKMDNEFEDFDLNILGSGVKNKEEDLEIRFPEPAEEPEVSIDPIRFDEPAAPVKVPDKAPAKSARRKYAPSELLDIIEDEPEEEPVAPEPEPEPEPVPVAAEPVEEDFDEIDISKHVAAPMEETDEDAVAATITQSLKKGTDSYTSARREVKQPKKEARRAPRYEEEYDDYDDYDDEPRRGGKGKIVLVALLGLALIGGGAVGVKYLMNNQEQMNFYRTHFLPGTTINGIDCTDMTVEEVEKAFSGVVDDYQLTIAGMNSSAVLDKEDAGMTMSIDLDFKDLLEEQDHKAYKEAAAEPKNYTITTAVSVDEATLKASLESLDMFTNMTPSSSCSVTYNTATGRYDLTEAVHGDSVDLTAVQARVVECYKTLTPTLNLQEEGFYGEIVDASPEVRAAVESMNKALGANVSLDFDDAGTETVSQEMILQSLKTDDQMLLNFDNTSLLAWINTLSAKYDTYGSTHSFTTTTGSTITVSGGNFGWKMDVEKTAEAVKNAILAGETVAVTPEYSSKGGSHGASDIGSTYVEVNLNLQKLYFYQDGTLKMSTDIISGDVHNGKYTATGVYTITGKQENKTMTINGVERHVAQWMPYYDGYGICEANWRTNFGGQIYLTDGTMGSIYVSTSAAESLYSYISVGTPIVIFGGQTSYTAPVTTTKAPTVAPTSPYRPTQPTTPEETTPNGDDPEEPSDEPATEPSGSDEPDEPTQAPTQAPTEAPTEAPTQAPTEAPAPTAAPGGDSSDDLT